MDQEITRKEVIHQEVTQEMIEMKRKKEVLVNQEQIKMLNQ